MTAGRSTLPRAMDALVRVLRWHRRSIAAVAAFIAVFAGLSSLQPPRATTVPVVVAARDLPGGSSLAASDLMRLELPSDAAPAGSFTEASALVGRSINAPVSARSPITSATVSTGATLARPGFVVVAVPLQNAALAELLQAGTHVDLLAAGRASPVASDARVVAPPNAEAGGLLASGQRVLLVEVTPEAAGLVVAAIDAGGLGVAVH